MARPVWFSLCMLIVGAALPVSTLGQEEQPEPERLKLLHANELQQLTIRGKPVRVLKGDVAFQQGGTSLHCQRATYYLDRAQAVFEEQVEIKDSTHTLKADRVIYHELGRSEEAIGNVRYEEPGRKLTADRAGFNQLTGVAVAVGNVVLMDEENGLTLTAGRTEHRREEDHFLARQSPVATIVDTVTTDTLRIAGNEIEGFNGLERIIITDSVRISKGSLRAACQRAEYRADSSSLKLMQHPVAHRGHDEIAGREMELMLDGLRVKEVHVLGKASITSPADTTGKIAGENVISGEVVTMIMEAEKLSQVRVQDQATSVYHVIEEGRLEGVNQVTGDRLHLYFSEGKLKDIKIEGDPGLADGTFYPPGFEPHGASR